MCICDHLDHQAPNQEKKIKSIGLWKHGPLAFLLYIQNRREIYMLLYEKKLKYFKGVSIMLIGIIGLLLYIGFDIEEREKVRKYKALGFEEQP